MCEELEKSKNKILELINSNNDKIRKIDENINIIEKSMLKNRLGNISLCLVAGIDIIILIYGILVYYYKLPVELFVQNFPSLVLFSTPVLGVLIESIPASINNRKLKQITSAKTTLEKKEEVLKNEIELEKLKNKNIVLYNTYEYIDKKQEEIKFFKEDLKKDKENIDELHEKNNELNKESNENEQKLEVVSTQNVLNSKFEHVRNRIYKPLNVLKNTFLPMAIVSISTFVVILALNPTILVIPGLPSFILPTCLSTGVLSGLLSMGVSVHSNKEDMGIFEKFNKKLGKYRLVKYNEQTNEKSKLRRKTQENINELSKKYIELAENEMSIIINNKSIKEEKFDDEKKGVSEFVDENIFSLDEKNMKRNRVLVKRK